jgi:hypothetical protein
VAIFISFLNGRDHVRPAASLAQHFCDDEDEYRSAETTAQEQIYQ